MVSADGQLGFLEIRDLEISHDAVRFVEQESVPPDSRVAGKTWRYLNKNGTPDRRFKDNCEIPIVEYHEFYLRSKSGLNEGFLISNADACSAFCSKLIAYQTTLRTMKWAALPELSADNSQRLQAVQSEKANP
jgi:hypothetical protein